ncbi:hypothetical protein ACS0TY_024788 [Phlomoides rotata]
MARMMKAIEDLQAQVATQGKTSSVMMAPVSPLSSEILKVPIQKKIQYPLISLYDGEGDPRLWKYYEDGKLVEFVKKPPAPRTTAPKRSDDDEEDQDEDLCNKIDRKKRKAPPMPEGSQPREILMLQPDLGPMGGYSEGGIQVSTSKRKIKAVVRDLDHVDTRVGLPPREAKTYPHMFTENDLNGILMPHNDPLVINMNIMGTKVHRLLVDTRSYANIIFRTTLDKLGNYKSYLEPCNHRILGFGDAVSIP